MAKSISDIKKELELIDLENIMSALDEYREDTRGGVVKLIASFEKKYSKLQEEKERIRLMRTFENNYPKTFCSLTSKGKKAFAEYVEEMKKYLNLEG